jgi:1,4-dihydroxy-2-naphthoate polyprenyltransferase
MRISRNGDPVSATAAGSPSPGVAAAWWHALRPRTLPAGAVPVVVGSALAVRYGAFHGPSALAALMVALLLQIATNLGNDYWDHVKGADTPNRKGRPRVVSSGLLPAHHVRNAALAVFLLAGFVGLSLVPRAGLVVLLIGAVSILAGIFYTAGPKPLGYIGLGDLSVFVFFGPVAVMGTFYVQALTWDPWVLLASVPVGALATAILVVNNLRDLPTDRAVGKNTFAVLIGPTGSRAEYLVLVLLAYLVPFVFFMQSGFLLFLLPMVSLPLAFFLVVRVFSEGDAQRMNALLERTAMLLLVHGLLFSAAFVLLPQMGVTAAL